MEVYGFPRFYLLAWFKECLLTAHHIPNNILVTSVVWEKKDPYSTETLFPRSFVSLHKTMRRQCILILVMKLALKRKN